MMVVRKVDGTGDESSAEIFVNLMQLCITCGKSAGLHLAEPGFTAGWQSVRLANHEA